jgi:tetratricopeptide (TPR) repeat protein
MNFVMPAKFYMAAGSYHSRNSSNQHISHQLLEKALKVSRSCGDANTQCSTLTSLAAIKLATGDHGNAWTHVHEARRLANLTGNLYQEAHLLRVLAQCLCRLGDYQNSIEHLHRAQEILDICGLAGGWLENFIKGDEAEVHLLKSEYTEARSIHTQTLQLTDQDPMNHAWALINIARIDVMLDTDTEDVQHNLNEAKTILSTTKYVFE